LLANERTFLAYLRTAIMLAASGVTMFKILGRERTYFVLGIAVAALSVLVAFFGYVRFEIMRKRIAERGDDDHRIIP
jgi:putative membrane protein